MEDLEKAYVKEEVLVLVFFFFSDILWTKYSTQNFV